LSFSWIGILCNLALDDDKEEIGNGRSDPLARADGTGHGNIAGSLKHDQK